jgi:beta-xylosidase
MNEGDFAGLTLFQRRYAQVGVKFENGNKSIVMIVSAQSEKPVEMAQVALSQNVVTLKPNVTSGTLQTRLSFLQYGWQIMDEDWLLIKNGIYVSTFHLGYRFGLFNYTRQSAGGMVDLQFFH